MYLRFKTSFVDAYEGKRYGVFQAAYYLLNSDELYEHDKARLDEVWAWFRHHLNRPDVYQRNKPEYNAICWFKPTAQEHVQKMHEMIGILELYGYNVWKVKCRKPGYVVYEDDEQVAVIPFGKLARHVR